MAAMAARCSALSRSEELGQLVGLGQTVGNSGRVWLVGQDLEWDAVVEWQAWLGGHFVLVSKYGPHDG